MLKRCFCSTAGYKYVPLSVFADLSRFRPVYAPKDFLEVTPVLYLARFIQLFCAWTVCSANCAASSCPSDLTLYGRTTMLTNCFVKLLSWQIQYEKNCWTLLLFTQVLINLRNPNHNSSENVGIRSHWGLIQVPLSVRDIPQLVGRRQEDARRQESSLVMTQPTRTSYDTATHTKLWLHTGKKLLIVRPLSFFLNKNKLCEEKSTIQNEFCFSSQLSCHPFFAAVLWLATGKYKSESI